MVTWYWFIFLAAGFAVVIFGLALVKKNSDTRPLIPVVFYPPAGVDPLKYSAFWNGYPKKKDVPLIILQWAAQGCVKIKRDGRRDVIITRIKNLPEDAGKYQKAYFAALFYDDDEFHSRELRGKQNAARREMVEAAVSGLMAEAQNVDAIDKRTYKSRKIFAVTATAAVLVYSIYFVIFNPEYFFFIPFFAIHLGVPTFSTYGDNNKSALVGISIFGLVDIGVFLPMLISGFCGATGSPFWCAPVIFWLVFAAWWFVCTWYLQFKFIKRTPECQKYYGEMLGFRKFILTAEVPQIEALAESDPDYFLNILPYCIVMGLSKKVGRRFKMLGFALPENFEDFGESFTVKIKNSLKGAARVRKLKKYTNG